MSRNQDAITGGQERPYGQVVAETPALGFPQLQTPFIQPQWNNRISDRVDPATGLSELDLYRAARDNAINRALIQALERRSLRDEPLPQEELINPLGEKAGRVTGVFGSIRRGSNPNERRGHGALDVVPSDGSGVAEVHAISSGEILYVGYYSHQSGHVITMLDSNNRIVTYAHFEEGAVDHLRPGQWLEQGQLIAPMGGLGRDSSGPHAHISVRELPEESRWQAVQAQARDAVQGLVQFFAGGDAQAAESNFENEAPPNPAYNYLQYAQIDPVIQGRTYRRGDRVEPAPADILYAAANPQPRGVIVTVPPDAVPLTDVVLNDGPVTAPAPAAQASAQDAPQKAGPSGIPPR